MELILVFILLFIIIVLTYIFKINFKELKSLEKNEDVKKLTDKFPENIEIAKEILKIIKNEKVTIEENQDEKSQTSLYIAITDKIIIAKMKDNYARIQTIAHECAHSKQDRRILLFNFILSNIYLLYFAIISILTVFKIITNPIIYFAILVFISMVQFAIRCYLEVNAMTEAKFIANRYMEEKNIVTKEEREKVIKSYEEINKIGIPFITYQLLVKSIIKMIIYLLIALIV